MNKTKVYKNVITGFGGQCIILVLGIIVPRILLTNYGSDTNGLLSTITQIFTYMALLEAGVGQAARNLLYKPIAENDKDGFSYIVSIARRYFRKLSVVYAGGVILLSICAPFVLKSSIDKMTICLVVLFQGLAGVVNFYFVETQTIILTADGHGYVNNVVNVINQIASYSAKIVMALLGLNIIVLQFTYFIITVCKGIFYKKYFKDNYPWIDYDKAPSHAKLKDRNSYIVAELAWTLFSSTDMIVLSTFVSTQMSSVYSIYNMVFTSINLLLNAVYSSLIYILGKTYHEGLDKYVKVHDAFMSVFVGAITILMSVSYFLIIPFVKLYTAGVSDVEYIYPLLPVMFCLVQLISWSRYITGNLTAIAGYAKQTGRISLVEAGINVVLSIVLVQRFGIVGVLFATVVALPVKVIYCTYLSDVKILKRSPVKTLRILIPNYLIFGACVMINKMITININNFFDFVIFGILFTAVIASIGILINLLVNRDCLKIIKVFMRRKGDLKL